MKSESQLPKILVGPAGWSYKDWNGIAYPKRRPAGFHEASYLAEFFDTIELNVTFYRPIAAQTAHDWIDRVSNNPNFSFTAKLWEEFTHNQNLTADNEKIFRPAIEVLRDAGKLGALLAQFPWSFKNSKESFGYLEKLFDHFKDFPLVLEVRHSSWDKPEVYSWLRQRNIGFCNIDQPIIGRSIRPSEHITSAVGYIRLHGRNYDEWFRDRPEGEHGEQRYNYLYTAEELEPWLERIRSVEQDVSKVFVILNNHFESRALVNAFQIVAKLTGKKQKIPEPLLERYPELQSISVIPRIKPDLFSR